jgi:hypothetical protein
MIWIALSDTVSCWDCGESGIPTTGDSPSGVVRFFADCPACGMPQNREVRHGMMEA